MMTYPPKSLVKRVLCLAYLTEEREAVSNVISEVGIDDEAKFNFYLGVVRMKKFVIKLDKDNLIDR